MTGLFTFKHKAILAIFQLAPNGPFCETAISKRHLAIQDLWAYCLVVRHPFETEFYYLAPFPSIVLSFVVIHCSAMLLFTSSLVEFVSGRRKLALWRESNSPLA